ncbi:M28 family metallopeptidase [Lysobacter arvi]|uniref:M28 family peptidase n=1 Tax=Lysobacter arvi TaxID=3038776 RepID=A0ABU1C963_9GAMM|nr:M28 family peptidase [Lysobacter arvi]MDR0181723.1 M28 family peptidase [Lysobacter arvi]
MHRLLVATLPILFLSACATSQPSTQPAQSGAAVVQPASSQWLSDVRAISDAGENAQRRKAIAARLDALQLAWRKAPFEANGKVGENLIADVAGRADAPLLLIGAHSDRVAVGHGATDNASGSASVLALAERLQRQPLKHHRVAVAFWDLEEEGLLGSKAYVADGSTRPALYVNFDVFGWGDTLWMMAPGQTQTALVDSSRVATQALRLGFSPGEQYPPTDHLPFVRAGWPAVSYSLVGADEITQVLEAYAGKKPRTPAKVMRVIHTDQDVIGQIDATAAVRGVDAVERALREWDAKAGAGGPSTTMSENSR